MSTLAVTATKCSTYDATCLLALPQNRRTAIKQLLVTVVYTHGRNVKLRARMIPPAFIAVRTTVVKVTGARTATPAGKREAGTARTTYLQTKVSEHVSMRSQKCERTNSHAGTNHDTHLCIKRKLCVRSVVNIGVGLVPLFIHPPGPGSFYVMAHCRCLGHT